MMSLAEGLLVLAVTLVVFGPKQLTTVLPTWLQGLRQLKAYFGRVQRQWHELLKEVALAERQQQAKAADQVYQTTAAHADE